MDLKTRTQDPKRSPLPYGFLGSEAGAELFGTVSDGRFILVVYYVNKHSDAFGAFAVTCDRLMQNPRQR